MPEVIIIGGGPAGISAALYIARAGFQPLIIENGPGSLAKAHLIQNYYGLTLTGAALYQQGLQQARDLNIDILHDEVIGINYLDSFSVETVTQKEPLTAPCLLLATGTQPKAPAIMGLKDFEGRGVSYCAVCDGFFFRKKAVAVLGNGPYALHEAEYLSSLAESVTILTNGPASPLIQDSGLTYDERLIDDILGANGLESIEFFEGEPLAVKGLFVAYGSAGTTDIARKLGLETQGSYILTDAQKQTNIPGLFAAGDCTGGLLQVAKAVHDGAAAGTAIVRYLKQH